MPTPNAEAIKAQFEEALDTYKDNGPGFAVRHVIKHNSLTAEDVALAWFAPEVLDEQSTMTESEQKQFDAQMKAKEKATADVDSDAADADEDADSNTDDIDGTSSPSDRAAATKKATIAGPAGGDLNPKDGGEKKPAVGGDVAKAPVKK